MNKFEYLPDKELLKILIREKSDENIIDCLIHEFSTLPQLLINSEEAELRQIKGIGEIRSKQIKAAAELARRLYKVDYSKNKHQISSPKDAAEYVMNDMRYLRHEVLRVIMLNTKNYIIADEIISMGSLDSSIVHPRELYIKAIKNSSSSVIIYHNHPSGDPNPSNEDINLTHRIKDAGKILGINCIDHIIIGDGKYISLKERGIL